MFTKEIQERTHWVDPTLKQVKPSLETPKKKKIHYKTRPWIKKNNNNNNKKSKFKGISGKEKKNINEPWSFFLDQPISLFVCFFLLLSCSAPQTSVSSSPLLFLLLLLFLLSFNFLVPFLGKLLGKKIWHHLKAINSSKRTKWG